MGRNGVSVSRLGDQGRGLLVEDTYSWSWGASGVLGFLLGVVVSCAAAADFAVGLCGHWFRTLRGESTWARDFWVGWSYILRD